MRHAPVAARGGQDLADDAPIVGRLLQTVRANDGMAAGEASARIIVRLFGPVNASLLGTMEPTRNRTSSSGGSNDSQGTGCSRRRP